MCADQRGYLGEFPSTMPAANINELVFERRELATSRVHVGFLWTSVLPLRAKPSENAPVPKDAFCV